MMQAMVKVDTVQVSIRVDGRWLDAGASVIAQNIDDGRARKMGFRIAKEFGERYDAVLIVREDDFDSRVIFEG